MTSTKLKRKVTSMRRSSTIQTLMPVEKIALTKSEADPVKAPKQQIEINNNNNKMNNHPS